MRILKLNLIAFGPFTDISLDLSEGQEGLHIIYGPNEAGKSSSLRAITDFFYGFESRTPDNFVHPYPRLRIGAQLRHSDGVVLDAVRRKANQKSLRKVDDIISLNDGELSRFLGPVDRELFQVMFGIDHERLRRGGEEIVQGGGRIGELLFATGAGLVDLQKVQIGLRKEIDTLLKSSGRSGAITTGIKGLLDKRKSVKQAQVSVDTWKTHDVALNTAKKQKNQIDEIVQKKRGEHNRLERIREAVSPIGRWRKSSGDLLALRDVPLLPEKFADKSNNILIEAKKAEQQKEDAEANLAEIADQLAVVSIPEKLLREADVIESLGVRLGGCQKAMSDRPSLETSRELAESEAREILRTLGRSPDLSAIESLRLPGDKVIRIQSLGNQQEGLVERLQGARRDCERIRREIARADTKSKDIGIPFDANELRVSLRNVQSEGDLESQAKGVCEELQRLEQNAWVALSQLALWSGSLEEIEGLAVPLLNTVERFDDSFRGVDVRIDALLTRRQEAVDARQNIETQMAQLELDQKVPSSDELASRRQRREQGWQLVLVAWLDGNEDEEAVAQFLQAFPPSKNLPEAYHRSVDESDQIADLLRNDAERVATKAKLQADREQKDLLESTVGIEIQKEEAERRGIEERWKAAWKPLGITPHSPQEMRDWIRRQQEVAQAAGEIRTKRLAANQLNQRIESLTSQLAAALNKIEPEFECGSSSLRELSLHAVDKCDEIQKAESLVEKIAEDLESGRHSLVEAESRFSETESELKKWKSEWAAEMIRLGLEDDAVPAEANSVLTGISNLFKKHQDADQFRTRIEGIDRDARDFDADVRELADRIEIDFSTKSADEIFSLLTSGLKDARAAKQTHESLIQRRNGQQKKLQCATELYSETYASLDEMCRQAGCTEYQQLSEVARQSIRRRELERSVKDYEEQILGQSGGAGLEEFVAEAEKEAADIDSVQPRMDALDEEIEQLGRKRDELVGQIKEEELELKKIDGSAYAAEKAAECEGIASRLEEQVQELAVLRVASAVLHAGIERYRKQNQGPVLGRASEIFRHITLGAFDGLRADYNERGEPILTGVRNGGGDTISVGAMSDGTSDQLYLALRLAGLETWLDRHEAIPFIVDDVLLNFDDDRAIACLQVLTELSRRTQVIFFTHHQHVVEMAKDNLSSHDLFVANLNDRSTVQRSN